MINFRICGIAAGIAFVLSLVIGLFSQTAFSALLLRAVVFALVFFALSGVGFWLVSRYLPELLSGVEGGGGEDGEEDDLGFPAPGSRVDISVGGEGKTVAGAFPEDGTDAVDDISGTPSANTNSSYAADDSYAANQAAHTPLDHAENTGYTEEKDITDDIGSFIGLGTTEEASAEALPDMGSFAEADSLADEGQEVETESFDSPQPRRPSSKKPAMEGDFDPKELAKAIQTVLKKDDKG
jgi:hypothetical protein